MIGGYYRFYPGDYFRDTSGLTMLEHGAYNLLLHNYYAACGKLEYEKPRVYEMCHARTPEDRRAVDYILNKFFRVNNGALTNNRADEELAERARYFETQRRNGLLGGRPKKNPRVSKLSTGAGVAPKSPKITQNNPWVNLQPPGNETESGEKAEKDAQKKTPPGPGPCPGPCPDPVPEPEVKSGAPDGAAHTKRFIKPTLDQVTAYCAERENGIDPQLFIDSNDAKGWVVGTTRTPMKDWKATIRTWERRNGSGTEGLHGKSAGTGPKAIPGKYAGIGTVVHTDPSLPGGDKAAAEGNRRESGSAEKVS